MFHQNHNITQILFKSKDLLSRVHTQPYELMNKTKTDFMRIGKNYKLKRVVPSSISNLQKNTSNLYIYDQQYLYQQKQSLKKTLNTILDQNQKLKTKISFYQRQNSANKRAHSHRQNFIILKDKKDNIKMHVDRQSYLVKKLKDIIKELNINLMAVKQQNMALKKSQPQLQCKELETLNRTLTEQYTSLVEKYNILYKQVIRLGKVQQQFKQVAEINKDLLKKNKEYKNTIQINLKISVKMDQMESQWTNKQNIFLQEITTLKKKNDNLQIQLKQLKVTSSMNNYRLISSRLSNNKFRRVQKSNSINNFSSRKSKDEVIDKYQQQISYLKEYIAKLQRNYRQSQQKMNKLEGQLGQKRFQREEEVNLQNQSGNQMNIQYHHDEMYSRHYTRSEYSETFYKSPQQRDPLLHQKAQTQPNITIEPLGNSFSLPQQSLNGLRKLLTYRMMGQKYRFSQLKDDITATKLPSFTYIDLCHMLINQPFYLTVKMSKFFLQFAFDKQKLKQNEQISSLMLINKFRKVIDDFVVLSQQQQNSMLFKIANLLTNNKKKITQRLNMKKNLQNTIREDRLYEILAQITLQQKEIMMIISELSVYSNDLEHINYQVLFQRFTFQSQNNNSIYEVQNDDSFINSMEIKSKISKKRSLSDQNGGKSREKLKKSHEIYIQENIAKVNNEMIP